MEWTRHLFRNLLEGHENAFDGQKLPPEAQIARQSLTDLFTIRILNRLSFLIPFNSVPF